MQNQTRLHLPPASNASQSDAGWSAKADGGQVPNNWKTEKLEKEILENLKKTKI